jgi:PAS domain S-box-containing protein
MSYRKTIKYVVIVSCIIAVLHPLANIYLIFPSFKKMSVRNAEDDAVYLAQHLASTVLSDDHTLKEPSSFERELKEVVNEFKLEKLKVFTNAGKIIYSTDRKDIGKINDKSYFYNIVTKGDVYTKVVRKGMKTLEDRTVRADVVETYVPIMGNGSFVGAFEIYYDITQRTQLLKKVMTRAASISFSLMFGFFVVLLLILFRKERAVEDKRSDGVSSIYRSPMYMLLIMVLSIFLAESVVMLMVSAFRPMSWWEEALFDAAVLVMLISPVLYFFLFKPLIQHISLRSKAEDDLQSAYHDMERRVQDRTAELDDANEQLKRDIAERQKALKQLQEMELRYRTLFETSSDGILLIDIDGNMIAFNEAAHSQLGYTSEEFKQLSLHDIDPVQSPEEIEASIKHVLETGKAEFQVKHKARDGSWRDVLVITQVIELAGRSAFHTIWRDITEQKKKEEELLKIEKLESIGVLAGGLAHDFNNLLTGILGNISIIKMAPDLDAAIRSRLNEAKAVALKAKGLTQQLLTFSTGGAPIKKTASIHDLIQESCNFALGGSNVKCEYDIPDDLWPVYIDEGQMSQVMHNLIINADHAMPQGGTVTIRCRNSVVNETNDLQLSEGSYVKISMRDEGEGIAEEHIQKIFDPYFTTKQSGSGLGLASAYSIINRHDGHILVESERGKGTVFTIYLKASDKKMLDRTVSNDKIVQGDGRILLMDDEETVIRSTSVMLNVLGYKVKSVKNGEEALAAFREGLHDDHPYDAIIMDLTIPGGKGGKETIGELLEIDPGAKVIVSSGYSNDPVMANFEQYGFSAVLVKPYEVVEFSRVLHSVINS